MRLALLGAFPFPLPQGSQVFASEQARALRAAGAETLLLSYGSGRGAPPEDLALLRTPAWTAPRRLRSGPSARKPLADAALLGLYVRAARRRRLDAVLAHNAEAALVALAARPLTGVPVVYVTHTLLRHELSAYASPRWERALARIGRRLDAAAARRSDAVQVLCDAARAELEPCARGPLAVIPPGLETRPPPETARIDALCRSLSLPRGRFVLYAGNLDAYQELDLLADAARRLEHAPEAARAPVVVATHETSGASSRRRAAGLRCIEVADFETVRTLCFAAGVLVLTRRRPGGFPIKLLSYMEAARPILAYAHLGTGLEHGRSGWLLPLEAGGAALAEALATLLSDAERAARLGAEARRRLEAHHAWPVLARRTLALVERVREARGASA